MTPPPPPPPAVAPPAQATPQQQSLAWLWTTTMHPASKRKRERSITTRPPASSSQTAREKRRSDKKRQRLLRKAGTRDRVARVFQTEGVPHHVARLLDVGSVEAFVIFLGEIGVGAAAPRGHDAVATSSHRIFQDEALWSCMLDTHFKTSQSVDQTASSWASDSSATIVEITRCTSPSSRTHWMDKLLKLVGGGCASLVRFLAWSHKREWFDKHVDVIMGDDTFKPRLREPDFSNIFTAAASELGIRKNGGKALAPGFDLTMMLDAQVRCRIHVIDTQMALESPWESLSRSFEDALQVMQREKQKDIAVVVPSSGSTLDHPRQRQLEPNSTAPDIATTGLRKIQRFAIQSDWNGQLGIVCYDKQHFLEFQAQKQKLLDAFGSVNG